MIRLLEPKEAIRRVAIALIPESADGNGKWLCVWKRDRGCLDFITASYAQHESPRSNLLAEVCKSLTLTKRDLLVSNMAQINLDFEISDGSSAAPSCISVSFYHVFLYRQSAMATLAQSSDVRWLSAGELLRGETSDGYAVNSELSQMLAKSDVIPSW